MLRLHEELTEAIRLSVQYVGTDTLQAQPGWTWFDALMKYAPHKTKFFVPDEDDGEETKAEEFSVRLGRVAQEASEAVPYGSGTEALHLAVGEAVLAELASKKAWQDLEDDAYNRNVPGYVPKTDGYKGNLVDDEESAGTVNDEAVSLSYWLAQQLGEHSDDASDRGETLTDTVQRLMDRVLSVRPENYATDRKPNAEHVAAEDKPDFKPNAMAVYASDTDERVVIHSPDRTTFKYTRGAFNQNGDFVTLDRLREVPDGYRKVNWGRDDIEVNS